MQEVFPYAKPWNFRVCSKWNRKFLITIESTATSTTNKHFIRGRLLLLLSLNDTILFPVSDCQAWPCPRTDKRRLSTGKSEQRVAPLPLPLFTFCQTCLSTEVLHWFVISWAVFQVKWFIWVLDCVTCVRARRERSRNKGTEGHLDKRAKSGLVKEATQRESNTQLHKFPGWGGASCNSVIP